MQTADEAFEPKKRPKNNASGNWWWLIMLHSTWVILFGIGALYGFASWRFVSAGSEVPATVISLTENYSSDSGTTYSPVFEYRVNGQTYTYESVNTSDPPSHQVGDHTTLLVDPKNPQSARENTFWELWLLPVIMCPVSLLVAVIAIVLTFVIKPWK